MKIKVSDLVQNVIVLGGEILTSFVGAKLAERDSKEKATPEEVAREIVRTVLKERDDELLKELIQLQDEGVAIAELLKEANRQGFVKVGDKVYREGLIERLLRSINPEDRPTVFRVLNKACARSREEFFGLLGILHNDNWLQMLRVAGNLTGEELDKLRPSLRRVNRKLQPMARRLHAEAERKGWRSWLDF